MDYKPDRWIVVKVKTKTETFYKIFATWFGGYLTGSSWKMNSGIEYYTESKDYYYFHGSSGSVYICNKNQEGFSGYGAGIFNQLQESVRPNTLKKITMKTYRETHNAKPITL